jgi:hypothetical protein
VEYEIGTGERKGFMSSLMDTATGDDAALHNDVK